MPIVKLNTDFITNHLHCPEGKRRIEYCDKSLPGFLVEVSNTSPSIGSFRLRYRDDRGATRYISLGRTNVVQLAEARKKAKKLKAEIALGADPRNEQKELHSIPNFSDYFTHQYLPYAKAHKRTWSKDSDMFRLRLRKEFGHIRLDQIRRQHIASFHAGLKEQGLSGSTCDHHLRLLKRTLHLCVQWEIIPASPATHVPLFNIENKIEHYLDEAQLERLLTVLRTDENRPVCQVALFLLSTGARLNEALQAQWRHIDREHKVWRIPAANSKSKKVRSVPLNDSALDVLDQLTTENFHDYLFINRKTGKPYTTIYKIWTRLRKDAGLPHLRIHDLRHQYASFLVNSGRTLYEVQQILGHSDPTVTQRYAHLSTRALQDAANSASDIISGSMGGSA